MWIHFSQSFSLRKINKFKMCHFAWNRKLIEKCQQAFRLVKQLLHRVWMTDKRIYTRGNTHVPYHRSYWYIEYLTVSKHARLREDVFKSRRHLNSASLKERKRNRSEIHWNSYSRANIFSVFLNFIFHLSLSLQLIFFQTGRKKANLLIL